MGRDISEEGSGASSFGANRAYVDQDQRLKDTYAGGQRAATLGRVGDPPRRSTLGDSVGTLRDCHDILETTEQIISRTEAFFGTASPEETLAGSKSGSAPGNVVDTLHYQSIALRHRLQRVNERLNMINERLD